MSASQTHYNQFLAHPYGQRFNEVLTLANYKYDRFVAEIGVRYEIYDDKVGQNGSAFTYLQNNEQLIGRAEVGFIVNPATNMQLSIGAFERMGKVRETPEDINSNTSYFYISFQTALINRYRDF